MTKLEEATVYKYAHICGNVDTTFKILTAAQIMAEDMRESMVNTDNELKFDTILDLLDICTTQLNSTVIDFNNLLASTSRVIAAAAADGTLKGE